MIIFNKQIFGDDALDFCSWPKQQQKEWIKKYTNQQSDEVIDDFLSRSLKNEEGKCISCGELNNIIVRHGDNISKTNAVEASTDSEQIMVGESGKGYSATGSKFSKKRKG